MALQVTSKQAYSQLLAAARCKVEYFPAHERLLSEVRDRHGASVTAAAEALAADAEAGRRETETLIDAIFGSRSPARRPPAAPRRRKRERPAAEKEEDLFGSASEGESEGEWESDEEEELPPSSSSSSSSESDVEAQQPWEGMASGPSVPPQVPSAQEGPPPPSDHQAPSSAAEAACQPDRALLSAETSGQPSQSGGGPEALTCSASDPQQQRQQQQPSSDVPHISTARGCSGTDEGLGPSSSNLAGRVAAREGGPSVDCRKRRRVHGTPGAAPGPPGDLAVHTSADLVGHTSAPDPPRPAGTSRIQSQTTEFVKAVLEPMYRAQLLTKEMFKAVVRSAVDKILERHAPQHAQEAEMRVPQHTQEGGQHAQKAQEAEHAGDSADFLIAEAEGIRRFISKLVVFEKSRHQAGPL